MECAGRRLSNAGGNKSGYALGGLDMLGWIVTDHTGIGGGERPYLTAEFERKVREAGEFFEGRHFCYEVS